MNEASPFDDPLEAGGKPSKLPGSINTLTILTFIGVGLGLIGTVYNFFMAEKNYENTEKMMTNDQAPGFLKGMFTPEALEMQRLAMQNKVPLLIITLVSLALCLYGAIQMRKLLKQGFYIYVTGQVFPLIANGIFVGFAGYMGWGALFAFGLPALFIILYATQLKYMK